MDKVQQILDKLKAIHLPGGVNLLQTIVFVVVVYFIWRIASRFLKRGGREAYLVAVQCPSCGWRGKVSQYNKKCSNCQSTGLVPAGSTPDRR